MLNTLAQSPDMNTKEYLGDHLKERLRNRWTLNKSPRRPKDLHIMVPSEHI